MPDFKQSEIISYLQMCIEEGVNLQRGMNFHLKGESSVILMSVRKGAPYNDRVEDNGRILIYEGHDIPFTNGERDPKTVSQPQNNPNGSLTQNGLFYQAAIAFTKGNFKPEIVRVYEKIKPGIWVYNGLFKLIDAWREVNNGRKVFKFKLELLDEITSISEALNQDIPHNRLIPTAVKLEVWKRDKGRCVVCGKQDNLHFDHIIPFSKGGASLTADNIQILCARHNLAKRDKIT